MILEKQYCPIAAINTPYRFWYKEIDKYSPQLKAEAISPILKEEDLINLPQYAMYIKLMIDGATSKPFSATTTPLTAQKYLHKQEIKNISRKRYCKTKEEVEQSIQSKYKTIIKEKTEVQNSLFN